MLYLILNFLIDIPFEVWLYPIILFVMHLQKDFNKNLVKDEKQKLIEIKAECEYFDGQLRGNAEKSGIKNEWEKLNSLIADYRTNALTADTELQENKTSEEIQPVLRRKQDEIIEKLVSFRSHSVKLRREQQKIIAKAKTPLTDLAQAEVNLKALNFSFYMPVLIFGGSILLSLALPILSDLREPEIGASLVDSNISRQTNPLVAPPAPSLARSPVEIPPISITDKEIAALPESRRNEIVDELIKRANSANIGANYLSAEKLLKFSLRFDKENAAVYNTLGQVSYNAGKYKAAEKYFDAIKKINPDKVDMFTVGMLSLELGKYEDAKEIFTRIYNKNPTYEVFYNLGLTEEKLKDYKAAAKAYRNALIMTPGDSDALYRLAISLKNTGDKEGVAETYYKLRRVNPFTNCGV